MRERKQTLVDFLLMLARIQACNPRLYAAIMPPEHFNCRCIAVPLID